MLHRTYKYRLYPTREQSRQLQWTLHRCRELYNAALQERRDAYRMSGKSLRYYYQSSELPAVKQARPEYDGIYSQVLQDTLRRVDKAFRRFFERAKAGKVPGYPRYKGAGAYDSFTYPQGGWSLHNDRLSLSKIGTLNVRLHRPVVGNIKTVTIKRQAGHWYVCLSVETPGEPLPPSDTAVGIDLGLRTFATLSSGETIPSPSHLRRSLNKLKARQQALSRRKPRSRRRERAKRALTRLHNRVRNQRADFLHKQSRRLVNSYGTLVFEAIQTTNLLHNHAVALSISDAGWGQFVRYCTFKAESAGRHVVSVDPRGTSQQCSACGAIQRKPLSQRRHSCPCGCELDRDHNAAINILRLGRSQQSGQPGCRSAHSTAGALHICWQGTLANGLMSLIGN